MARSDWSVYAGKIKRYKNSELNEMINNLQIPRFFGGVQKMLKNSDYQGGQELLCTIYNIQY